MPRSTTSRFLAGLSLPHHWGSWLAWAPTTFDRASNERSRGHGVRARPVIRGYRRGRIECGQADVSRVPSALRSDEADLYSRPGALPADLGLDHVGNGSDNRAAWAPGPGCSR